MTRVIRYGVPVVGIGMVALVALSMSRPTMVRRGAAPPVAQAVAPASVRAEGRVVTYAGAMVDVRSEIDGRVTMLAVTEQQQVHRGTVIAEIAADELRAALAEAHAQLTEADADTAWLTMEQQRNTKLVQTNSVPRQTLDKVTHDLAAARARHAVAEATVHRLNARLAKTRVTAPIDGTIVSRPVEVGDVVGPGTPLVTIANLRRRRVEAEVDEYDIGRVRLGAPVTITTEGGETQAWRGTVEEIPDMVVPRRLAPQDPGRPSAMKVLLVKVALPQTAPLKLGQRVELAIDTQSSRGVETAPRPAN